MSGAQIIERFISIGMDQQRADEPSDISSPAGRGGRGGEEEERGASSRNTSVTHFGRKSARSFFFYYYYYYSFTRARISG